MYSLCGFMQKIYGGRWVEGRSYTQFEILIFLTNLVFTAWFQNNKIIQREVPEQTTETSSLNVYVLQVTTQVLH